MTRVPCSKAECNEPARARAMCTKHYNAWNYARNAVSKASVRGCLACLTPISTPDARRYCSTECRKAARRAESAAIRAEVTKICPACSARFSPAKSMRQLYCSPRCSKAATRDAASRVCSGEGCDRPVRARGLCAMHWRRQARADGRESPPAWDDRRRAASQKRRAQKRGTQVEDVLPTEIFDRDGWCCGICAEPVSPESAWPDPLSPSLDHILPLALGGAHVRANVQLAHLACNVRKGARVLA